MANVYCLQCLNELSCQKKIKRREKERPIAEQEEFSDETLEKIADSLEKQEMKEALQECLNHLPDEEKSIIFLHETDGITFNEIAEILNIPISTVKDKNKSAKNKLFNCLKLKGVDSNDL
jgi:RNA polymerase sigma-70 factor (ECF subfamily)